MQNKSRPRRIASILAHMGAARSRRQAEVLIQQGRVQINGKILSTPAYNPSADDHIICNGQTVLLRPVEAKLWCYHKPQGQITTHFDPKGRVTVFSQLPADMEGCISVGRLDVATEGLLLLTNSRQIAHFLEQPCQKIKRHYRVRVYGDLATDIVKQMARGMVIDGVRYAPIRASIEHSNQTGRNHWLKLTLTEGKNREIRRIIESLNMQVSRLIRVSYGPFQLGTLQAGDLKKVPKATLHAQLASIGFDNEKLTFG